MEMSKRGLGGNIGHANGLVIQFILMSIPEVAKSLRLSRTKVYELIAVEGLPVVRFGRAVRVCRSSLEQWVQQREQSA